MLLMHTIRNDRIRIVTVTMEAIRLKSGNPERFNRILSGDRK